MEKSKEPYDIIIEEAHRQYLYERALREFMCALIIAQNPNKNQGEHIITEQAHNYATAYLNKLNEQQ